jgi:glycosyltransferase involved in cell wall biosynthesis
MNATLVIEHRFKKDSNGKIYASSNSVNTMLWERYLEVFDRLTIVARIQDVSDAVGEEYLVSHEKVDFVPIPYYVGPKQFVKQYFKIKKVIEAQVQKNQAFICRLPSILGAILVSKLKKENIPYVVELVGDPWEVFAPGSLKNTLSFIHRYRSFLSLRKNVKRASGVIYVTEKMLQKRYPSNKNAISTHASNVILKDEIIAKKSKTFPNKLDQLKIISIGSLEQMYKSPDIVLKALGEINKKEIDFELIWLGDGVHKEAMKKLAQELDIAERVKFKGNVLSTEVLKEIHNSNLYIHASRTEGLPRALIEAMAQGLPCIGTLVGGIPELLEDECLIEKNDIEALVQKITFFYEHPDFMQKMAEKNLIKAKEYEFNVLAARRATVYKHLENLVK